MRAIAAINLAAKFILELGAIAAFAYWGANTGDGAVRVLLAIIAPTAAVALWGTFAAPKATRRLPTSARIPFELTVFALAVAALYVAASTGVAIAFAVLVALNGMLLTALRQWEQ